MLLPLKGAPFALGEELTSVEMNILNDEIAHALDAVHGGSYTLDDDIIIAGSGSPVFRFDTGLVVEFVGSTTFTGTSGVVFDSTPEFGDGFVVSGGTADFTGSTIAFGGGTAITGSPNISGGTWAFSGSVLTFASSSSITVSSGSITVAAGNNINSNGNLIIGAAAGVLSINGIANVTSGGALNIQSGGTLTAESGSNVSVDSGGSLIVQSGGDLSTVAGAVVNFSATSNFHEDINVDAGVLITLAGVIVPTGAGRKRDRIERPDGTANITRNASQADIYHYSGMTAPRNFILTATGAALGDVVDISLLGVNNANQLTVQDDVAATIIGLIDSGTNLNHARLYFDGTAWQRFIQTPRA